MADVLSDFFTFVRSIYATFPYLIQRIIIAIPASFVAIALLKMFKR